MTVTSRSRRTEHGPRRGLLLVASVLVLVLLVAGVLGYLLLRGSDPDTSAGPSGGGGSADADADADASPTPDPLDDPLSAASIDLRYRGLAESVTVGAERCRSVKARQGQRERLLCDVPTGTLELVTYAGAGGLEARRERAVTYELGAVVDVAPTGTLKGFQPPTAKGPAAFLYWDDDRSRQSAVYLGDDGTDLEPLVRAYDATTPARPYPTGPSDRKLGRFVDRWMRPGDCTRIPTVNPGSTEESYCDVEGPVETFVGRFGTAAELKAYRKVIVASAIADDRETLEWKRGALYEYTTDDGTVARYWDDPSCACYAEAFWAKGTYERLARWWDR